MDCGTILRNTVSKLPNRAHFRDRRHFAIAAVSEIVAPALRVAARAFSRGPATPPSQWRRALIVGHGHIGDALYQTISLSSLASGLPHCEFDYLTTPVAAEVLARNPALANVLPWDTATRPGELSTSHMDALRATQYDAIICTNLVRHQEGLLLGLRLGIPNRVAFTHRGLSGLATLPVRLPHPMTPGQQSRVMAEAITGVADTSELRPRLFPTQGDLAAAADEFERLRLSHAGAILACSLTTRQAVGQVPAEFFSRIISNVHDNDPSIQIVLCGSAEDEATLRYAASKISGDVAISSGRMSVLAYAAFMERCSAFFGMDSGPRHLANAAGVPVFFVRNMAVRASEAGSYCPGETDIAPAGEFLDEDQLMQRLNSIDATLVAALIIAAIRENVVRDASRRPSSSLL